MGFLDSLLGRKPFSELKQRADQLRADGQHGDAKLAYERALEARDAPATGDQRRGEIRQHIDACCDAIADERVAQARGYLDGGHTDLAADELTQAMETAATDDAKQRVRDAMDQMEREDAREQVDAETPRTADDEFNAIAGSWDDDQHAEYVAYGEPFKRAIVALYGDRPEEARGLLDALAEEHPDGHYLWFEVGRARLAVEDPTAAMDALKRFLGRIGPDEGGDARLTAHIELAAMHTEAGDVEATIAEYQAALEALPDDPRPYLAMGIFFRSQELAEEAVDVLNSALAMLDDRPHFRVWQELGLAHAELGQDALAIGFLEKVVEYLVERDHLDLPPEVAMGLAGLYEKAEKLPRALDMVQMLCDGSDVANRHTYHLEAARLAAALELPDDHARHLARATELAPPDDPDFATALEAVQAASS